MTTQERSQEEVAAVAHDESMEPEHVAPALDPKVLAQLERYLPIIQLKRKVQNAAQTMASLVRIDEDHNYTRTTDGKWLAGVTSVSSLVPKDWLSAWGAKEAVKFLGFSDFPEDTALAEEMLAKIKGTETVAKYLALLKEAKGASARKSKEALLDGRAGHAWIETYIKAKIDGTEAPAIPDGMLKRPLMQFVAWEQEHVALWLLSEAIVCDTKREYAGTLDAVAIMQDGSLAIVDAKFASHVSPEYRLQCSGYQACLENYGVSIASRIIVRLPKSLTRDEWNPQTRQYEKKENTIEVVTYGRDTYEWDRDVFYAALPLKRWVNSVTKR